MNVRDGSRARTVIFKFISTSSLIALMSAISIAPQSARAQTTPQQTQDGSVVSFAIPAQSLNSAILAFADKAGVQVFYDTARVQGLKSPGVRGRFAPQDALGRILGGTGMTFRVTGQKSVSIVPSSQSAASSASLDGGTMLSTIVVDGLQNNSTGYVATRSIGGLKTDTPLIETPASVSVVTRKQLDDQNAQSVSQALRYTPGIVAEQRGVNEESLEYLYSRGFQANTYVDGMIIPLMGFNIATRDAYLFDNIESIRGPASVLYGQTPPGGIVNITSKMPTEKPFGDIFIETGSYGRIQGGFDVGGPLTKDGDVLYRVTATGLSTDTQTDYVDQKRVAIAPALTWKPDEDTKLTILGNYQNDPEAGNFNYVPAKGTVLPGSVQIPRSFNTGDPGFDRFRKEEASVGYSFEHRFNDTWQFKQNFRYLYNDQQIKHVGDGSAYDASGTSLVRTAYNNFGTVNAVTMDNQLSAEFDTGALTHKALFGVDLQNIQYDHYLYYGIGGPGAPALSVLDPVYYQTIPEPKFMLGTSNKQRSRQLGLYAQDQVQLGNATFVGSLRQDWAETETVAYSNGAVTNQNDHALTGRIGAIYNFDSGFAPYFSYSTSFQPQAGTTDAGDPLDPTEGKQYEIGLKYQPSGFDSFLTAALFDLRQTNVKVSNLLYPGSVTQTGEVRSRGVELEAHAFITDDLQAIASYTYTDVKNVEATANIEGKRPAGIPANMASAWLSYALPENVADGLTVSGGVRYFGESYGNVTNSFKAPSFTLVDLGLQYDFEKKFPKAKGVTGALNVSNLFDKTYVTCTADTYCTYGQGRLITASMHFKW